MNINLKVSLGVIYILCLGLLCLFIFNYLDIKDLTSYSYLKESSRMLIDFKNSNFTLFIILFFIFSAIWVLMLGFGSPVAILAGFIFGKWLGTFISVISFTIGASLLYFLARYYFSSFIKKHLSKKINKYTNLFNKNDFFYFMMFRLAGGLGIPFAVQNVLPVIFNMKLKNYFYATLLGLIPTIFIVCSLGSGIENLINDNVDLNYLTIISDPGIYTPLILFLTILILSYVVKKKIFK
jgi:uncharacterized membrane protein YdjX (TVP38/TMEM64 family)|tara:strand:+ start:1150 stop:1863 length:714 start_codon:yes stop_codon:yes gene_type:complete